MALKRPGFVGSAAANDAALARGDKFLKFKDGDTKLLRFLPAPKEDGIVFYPVTSHYVKSQDGDKKAALACNRAHGNDETGRRCLICDVVEMFLKEDKDDEDAKEIRAQTRQHTQVLEGTPGKDGKIAYSAPKFPAWSNKIAGKINTIFKSMEKMGQPLAYDPDKGQALLITRDGEGLKTDYAVERTGDVVSLDVIRPTWTEEFKEDIYEAVGLQVVDIATQEAHLRMTFPRMNWAEIFEAVGYETEE